MQVPGNLSRLRKDRSLDEDHQSRTQVYEECRPREGTMRRQECTGCHVVVYSENQVYWWDGDFLQVSNTLPEPGEVIKTYETALMNVTPIRKVA